MNVFKRITASVTANLDRAACRIENHDAVVTAAIGETTANAAKARVRLARVERDGEILRRKQRESERMVSVWETRARRAAAADRDKALACIERRNRCREDLETGALALEEHIEMEERLRASVDQMQRRLAELTRQRNLMRSRESTAEAIHVVQRMEDRCGVGEDFEDLMDRWETRVTELEFLSGQSRVSDRLDRDFTQDEDRERLGAELDALLGCGMDLDEDTAGREEQ